MKGMLMSLMTDIHIRSFTGQHIKTYLHSLAKLLEELFKEYPFFRETNIEQQIKYIRDVAAHKESIAVLIFDNTTLVGASIGMPFAGESAQLHQPFLERHLSPQNMYYFSASLLLKPYRGRGIGHHFFDVREAHVLHYKKYTHICFCVPVRPEEDPERPDDYLKLDDFWRKRGYVHHADMQCQAQWTSALTQRVETQPMSCWMKSLSQDKS
jgi:hypothetical protein